MQTQSGILKSKYRQPPLGPRRYRSICADRRSNYCPHGIDKSSRCPHHQRRSLRSRGKYYQSHRRLLDRLSNLTKSTRSPTCTLSSHSFRWLFSWRLLKLGLRWTDCQRMELQGMGCQAANHSRSQRSKFKFLSLLERSLRHFCRLHPNQLNFYISQSIPMLISWASHTVNL